LGVTLYEMLSGARPFTGGTPRDVLNAIIRARPAPLQQRRPEVPAALSSIVSRCLSKDPADRFGSARDLLDALTTVSPDWPGAGGGRDADATAGGAADARCREGRLLLDGGDPRSAGRARDAFLEALRIKPDHALAWSGLSDAYELMAYLAMLPPEEAHLRARAAAERALEIEPGLAEAHVSLATVLVDYYRDWSRAGDLYQRALALKPEYAVGHQLYAEYLRDLGRFDEALAEIDQAIRLDPISPFFRMVRGIVLHMARRQEESLEALERLLQATPDYVIAHFFMSLPLAATAQFERALEALAKVDPDGTFPDAMGMRGAVLARMGRRDEAEATIQALRHIGQGHYVLPFHEAGIRIGLGEYDKAIELLEQDADRRSWFSRLLGVAPGLDELRSLPRFQALLARVRRGLTD
jgi:serine/threonine-protein kinase